MSAQKDPDKPPPQGNSKKAEKYIHKLIKLIDKDALLVNHTDLAKYDPSSLHDHYWVDLGEYQAEVSHSKEPDSGKDSYVIIFNNLKRISQDRSEKVILAYMNLDANQFAKFKNASDDQIERRRLKEVEKRLSQVMAPLDKELENLSTRLD